jgi:hypothetical protein
MPVATEAGPVSPQPGAVIEPTGIAVVAALKRIERRRTADGSLAATGLRRVPIADREDQP